VVGLWLVGCGLSADPAPPQAPPPAPPPSVLVVVLDTVRADLLARGDDPFGRAPNLGALAARGLTFQDVTAPGSWTWPSHASLFTGLLPRDHGARAAARDEGMALREALLVTPMDPNLPTLAERFVAGGYEAGAYVANRLLAEPLGLTRGFAPVVFAREDAAVVDAAVAAMGGPRELMFVNLMTAHGPYQLTDETRHLAPQLDDQALAPLLQGEGVSWHASEPSAVIRHGLDPLPPAQLALAQALYEGELHQVDRHLGRLLDAWWTAHPDGVVAVTSDHGELFGEHGGLEHSALVWPELTRVPLVLAGPGVPEGKHRDAPVMLQDLYPTLLALAGLSEPSWTLLSGSPRPGELVAAAWPRPHLADALGGVYGTGQTLVRDGPLAVISGPGEPALYDLASDPGMAAPLDRPGDLARLVPRLPALDATAGALALPQGELEALRALGYVE